MHKVIKLQTITHCKALQPLHTMCPVSLFWNFSQAAVSCCNITRSNPERCHTAFLFLNDKVIFRGFGIVKVSAPISQGKITRIRRTIHNIPKPLIFPIAVGLILHIFCGLRNIILYILYSLPHENYG